MNIRLQSNGPADKPTPARFAADPPSDIPSPSRSQVPLPPPERLEDSLQDLKNWPVPGAKPEVELCAYRPDQAEGAVESCAYRPAPEDKLRPADILQCAYFPDNPQAPQIKTPRPSGQEIETILDKLRKPQG